MIRSVSALAFVMVAQSALAAQPLASCVAADVAKIRAVIERESTTPLFGQPLAPATAYEGLNQAQVVASNAGAGVKRHIDEIEHRLRTAANEFIATKADPAQTATAVLGHADRRQVMQILRRPKGQPALTANTENKCNEKSCEDMALKTQMLYVLPNSSVARAVETLSVYKLETTGNVDVHFCAASASCRERNHLLSAGGAVQKSKNPQPMNTGVPYVLRESGMGVETTTVYKVHPVSICGKPAALMTGILVRGENAFDSSSTVALAVESDSRVMLFAHFQGYVAGGRGKVPGWMLGGGIVASIARNSFNGIYNKQAERLGTAERINGKGMLK